MANEPSSETRYSSRVSGTNNLLPRFDRDSPRDLLVSRLRRFGLPEGGLDNGKTAPGDGISPAHWPDSDGWPLADAIAELPSGKPSCNSGSMGVAVETSARSLSKDKSDGPDANGRLAPIVIHDQAEMLGQRESRLPEGQVSLRSANFAARRFSKFASPPSCDL